MICLFWGGFEKRDEIFLSNRLRLYVGMRGRRLKVYQSIVNFIYLTSKPKQFSFHSMTQCNLSQKYCQSIFSKKTNFIFSHWLSFCHRHSLLSWYYGRFSGNSDKSLISSCDFPNKKKGDEEERKKMTRWNEWAKKRSTHTLPITSIFNELRILKAWSNINMHTAPVLSINEAK